MSRSQTVCGARRVNAGVGRRLPGEHQPGLQAGVLDGQRGGEGAHLDRVGGIDGRDPHHEGQHQGQHQGAQVVPQPAQHGRPLSDPAEQGERGRSTARTRPASSAGARPVEGHQDVTQTALIEPADHAPVVTDRDTAGLLRNDDNHGVAHLADAQRRPVAQPHLPFGERESVPLADRGMTQAAAATRSPRRMAAPSCRGVLM